MSGKIQATSGHSGRGDDETSPLFTSKHKVQGSLMGDANRSFSATDNHHGERGTQQYGTSPLRWLVLAASATLNFSTAMNWVTFVSIADYTQTYYDVAAFWVNMLSLVFMVSSLLSGLAWAWVMDTVGLTVGLWIGVWLNTLGALVRYFSTFHPVGGTVAHFWMLMLGQCLSALSNPVGLYSPAKVADLWFPQERRALANMVISMGNPIGIALGMLIPPMIVNRPHDFTTTFPHLLIMLSAIAGASLLLTLFIHRNRPKVPPSPSGDDTTNVKLPFFRGLKQLVTNRTFIFLGVMWGIGVGSFNVFITFMEQMLCPYGYSDRFTGICGAAMSGVGLVGATITSLYVDRSKKFVPTLKICYGCSTLCLLGYTLMSFQPHQSAPVVIFLCLFGLFGFGLLPIMLELAVECTYPVNTGTSSAVFWLGGQLSGTLLVLVVQQPALKRNLSAQQKLISTCSNKHPQDMTYGALLVCALGCGIACLFILFFRTPYRRLHCERYGEGGQESEMEVHY